MSVVDWSDKHKINALTNENATLKARAVERETTIANQARTIARLYLKLREIRSLADEGVECCVSPKKQGGQQ